MIAAVIYMLAIYLYLQRRYTPALCLIIAGGALLRYYMITLDHFLNEWDERYHALVAKNMLHHWLKPTLFEKPILAYNYQDWYSNHIWLHKQPLFLWQMMLSMKVFGINEVAIRVPDLLLGTLLIAVIYDMGRQVFSKEAGLIAAMLYSAYGPLLELSSGFGNTDHNDVIFCCYVTLSLYCWIRYEKKGAIQYIILMGICCGLAVLTKWLTGLVAFAGLGFYHLFVTRDFFSRRTIGPFLLSVLVCAAVFVPWQIYILQHYPLEARFEYRYNSLHFSQVLEGKAAPWWFHLGLLRNHYKGLQWLMPFACIIVLTHYRKYAVASGLLFIVVLVYAFFSVAATKMFSFTLMVAPLNILFIAFVLQRILDWLGRYDKIYLPAGAVLLFLVLLWVFDYNRVYIVHTAQGNWADKYRSHALAQRAVFDQIRKGTAPNTVLLSDKAWDNISAMFYTDRISYSAVTPESFDVLRTKKVPLVFMDDSLPDFARGSDARTISQMLNAR